jgi:polysaccharide export outer membrane protein
MRAIPPNRQSTPDNTRLCSRTRLLTLSVRVAFVFVVSIGANQRAWSETSQADADANQSSTNEPQSHNALRFVGSSAVSIAPKLVAPQPALRISLEPTNTPPLTIDDYQHYIKTTSEGPRTEIRSAAVPVTTSSVAKQVNATAPVERTGLDNRPPYEPALRIAAVIQEKPIPARDGWLVREAEIIKPRPEVSAAQPENALAAEAVAATSAKTEPASVLASTPAAAPHIAMAEQAPPMPAPVEPKADEPKIETIPQQAETMPMAATDGPPMPMTSASFLPANPESYCFRCGVKCPPCGCNPGGPGWAAARPIPWEVFAQGEYVGPARLAHVPVYRLRVDDQVAFVYRLSGHVSGQPYRLNVRDRIQVQSLTAPEVINREVQVEPDGTITLPLLGQVRASGSTLEELKGRLDDLFIRQIKDPRITVTPIEVNSNLQELRSSVDRRYGAGGQVSDARISPDGTVQLPAIGSVPAQGLTLEELEREVKARYALIVEGLEVTPILTARAPRYVFVVGEVGLPGRYAMEGPTTLMQAITLAGSWKVGAQLNQVVVFRRDENWQLMATTVNIRESLLFKKPCASGEIWLRDSDIVLVPKSPILCADDVINLVFTRGIYGVFPMSATLNFAKLSSL